MREKFDKFLTKHGMREEFTTELTECEKTPYRTISELIAKCDDESELIAEAFVWKLNNWAVIDREWRIECNTKKRFYCKEKGFGV